MANEKYTKRNALNDIINNNITEDVITWAQAELKKLDDSNAKNRERAAKKREENFPLVEQLKELLTEEYQPAAYFAEATGLSSSKVTALFRNYFTEDEVQIEKIKGKSGKVNGYAAPTKE